MKKKFKLLLLISLFIFSFLVGTDMLFGATKTVWAEEEENDSYLPSAYCLRDEYFVQTTNQHGQGLCWNFASSSAFSTTVMRSTNQYIDYSEGWVSNYKSATSQYYTPGDGGSYGGFADAIENGGIVQEQDFNYEESYQVTKENTKDIYEYYKDFADTTIVKNYKRFRASYNNNGDEEAFEDFKMQAKYHILKEGGFYVDFGWTTSSTVVNGQQVYYRNLTNTEYSGYHALCIIGWDDNIEITHEDYTYKGAWIFLNSWGNNSGNEGIYYLLYDDPGANYFDGWEYVEEKDDLYFFNKLENSNAHFESNFKNAYTGTFENETFETKQKNVFYNQNDVELSYSYEISENTTVDNVSIFKNQTDVTNLFDIEITDNHINIESNQSLEIGAYKIRFEYSNQEENEWTCGAFYLLNGTETEYISISSPTPMNINKGIALQGVCGLQHGYNYLTLGTELENISVNFSIGTATYSNIIQMYVKNPATEEILTSTSLFSNPQRYFFFSHTFNFSQYTEYQLYIVGQTATKIFDIHFIKINTEENLLVRMNYNLDGGSCENQKLMKVNKTGLTEIQNPTRVGYGFVGWYYSNDFDEKTILHFTNGKYYVDYSHVIHYNDCTAYWTESIRDYSMYNFNSIIIYAKWFKLDGEHIYHTIYANADGNGYLSDKGINYIKEGSSKTFVINSVGYEITDILIDDELATEDEILEYLQNGIVFENVAEDHYLQIYFIPRTDTVYKVYHYKQSLGETENIYNEKYYDAPKKMTYRGTTDEMTNVYANTYSHFVVNDFAQQKILPDGSTIICIYYDREVFNIKITFEGIQYDSIKYDVDEDVLYNATRTYNLCPIGYNLIECKVNGHAITNANDYVLENIDNNYEINVKVELAKYKITTPVLQYGDVMVKGSRRNILFGEMKTFEVVAHEGYRIKNVYVNGQPIETDDGKFTILVKENLSINAEFESTAKPVSIFDSPIVLVPLGLTAFVFGAILIKVLIEKRRYY